MEVLFESRLDIESTTGKLRFIQAQPRLHPEPVVRRDTFVDEAGTTIWGTVLRDAGRYRMWYQPWPQDWTGQDVSLVGYAESDDGLNWEKRPLNLVEYGPTPNHLCDLGLHCPSVFIDPRASGERRYRAVGYGRPTSSGTRIGSGRGVTTQRILPTACAGLSTPTNRSGPVATPSRASITLASSAASQPSSRTSRTRASAAVPCGRPS